MDTADDLTYQLDLASGELTWSTALYAALGYAATEPANTIEWWTGHVHPDDAMVINQTLDKLFDPAASDLSMQYRLRKADNSYVAVKDQATVVRDQDGQAVRLQGKLLPSAAGPAPAT